MSQKKKESPNTESGEWGEPFLLPLYVYLIYRKLITHIVVYFIFICPITWQLLLFFSRYLNLWGASTGNIYLPPSIRRWQQIKTKTRTELYFPPQNYFFLVENVANCTLWKQRYWLENVRGFFFSKWTISQLTHFLVKSSHYKKVSNGEQFCFFLSFQDFFSKKFSP